MKNIFKFIAMILSSGILGTYEYMDMGTMLMRILEKIDTESSEGEVHLEDSRDKYEITMEACSKRLEREIEIERGTRKLLCGCPFADVPEGCENTPGAHLLLTLNSIGRPIARIDSDGNVRLLSGELYTEEVHPEEFFISQGKSVHEIDMFTW